MTNFRIRLETTIIQQLFKTKENLFKIIIFREPFFEKIIKYNYLKKKKNV